MGAIPLAGAGVGLFFSERGAVRSAVRTLAVTSVLLALALFGLAPRMSISIRTARAWPDG